MAKTKQEPLANEGFRLALRAFNATCLVCSGLILICSLDSFWHHTTVHLEMANARVSFYAGFCQWVTWPTDDRPEPLNTREPLEDLPRFLGIVVEDHLKMYSMDEAPYFGIQANGRIYPANAVEYSLVWLTLQLWAIPALTWVYRRWRCHFEHSNLQSSPQMPCEQPRESAEQTEPGTPQLDTSSLPAQPSPRP